MNGSKVLLLMEKKNRKIVEKEKRKSGSQTGSCCFSIRLIDKKDFFLVPFFRSQTTHNELLLEAANIMLNIS